MTDYLYKPLSRKKQARLDELTAKLATGIYIEKRDTDAEFFPGVLSPRSVDMEPFRVMVSPVKYAEGERVILCQVTFAAIGWAELVFEDELGQEIRIAGEVSASRPGQRAEDQRQDPPIQVARFYKGGRGSGPGFISP